MRKEVLIVESDQRSADALVLRLTGRGYGVASAASLGEAEQAVAARRPDLIILGLGLHGGERLIKRIRAVGGAALPVLLVGTGAEGIASTADAVAAGADDFFRKPGELELVVEKVAAVLGPGRRAEVATVDDSVDFSSLNQLAWSEPPRRVTPPGAARTAPQPPPVPEAESGPAGASPPATVTRVARPDPTGEATRPRAPRHPPDVVDWDDSLDLEVVETPRPAVAGVPSVMPQPTPGSLPPLPSLPAGLRTLPRPSPSNPPRPVSAPPAARPASATPAPRPASAGPAPRPTSASPSPALSGPPAPRPRPSQGPGGPDPVEPLGSEVPDWIEESVPAPATAAASLAGPPGGALAADRPGRGFQAAEAPVPEEEAQWQARLQPGRSLPLAERPLAVALAAAARLGLTGRIEVAAAGTLRRVFLDAGRPVFFDSSDPDEDLAATLAAEGLVTRAAVARARERARATGATADEVLIEQGFVAADTAYRALRTHVIERVVGLFGLESGDGLVVQGGPRPPDPVDLGLPPARLIVDGIRRRYGRLRLYQAYGTPVAVPRLRRHPGELLVLRADEEAVLRACDGRRTAAEIARSLRLGEVDVLATLYGLAVIGCLESPLGPTPGTLPPLPGDLLARAGAPRTPDELPGYADLVARKLADVQTADYFTILEVPRGATGAELEAAWDSLRRRFDPERLRPDAPLHGPVAEIAAVLDDARALLGDDRLRARYEAALGD